MRFSSRLATSRCSSWSLFCDIAVVAFLRHCIVLQGRQGRLFRLHYPTVMRPRSFPRLRNFTTVLVSFGTRFCDFAVFTTASLRLDCYINPHGRIFANPRKAWARKLATYEPGPQDVTPIYLEHRNSELNVFPNTEPCNPKHSTRNPEPENTNVTQYSMSR